MMTIVSSIIEGTRHTSLLDLRYNLNNPQLMATYAYDGKGRDPAPARFRICCRTWVAPSDKDLRDFILNTVRLKLLANGTETSLVLLLMALYPNGYEELATTSSSSRDVDGTYTVRVAEFGTQKFNEMTIRGMKAIYDYFQRPDAIQTGTLLLY